MTREAVAVSKAVGVTTLDGLTDVTITSAATGDVLRYNGTAWVDAVLAIADTSGLQTALDAKLGGSLGSTDNRVLRADGTGGSTAQNSAVTIDDSGNVTGVTNLTMGGRFVLSQTVESGNLIDVRTVGYTPFTVGFNAAVTCGTIMCGNLQWSGSNGADSAYVYTPAIALRGTGAAFVTDTVLTRASAGVVEINNGTTGTLRDLSLRNLTASGLIGLGTYTVATLPSASANAGRIAQVTDSSVTTNGSAVSGGGSNRVMVFSNGTNWDVVVA